jgi:hypothetical protein
VQNFSGQNAFAKKKLQYLEYTKMFLPVAKATLNKRVICSAVNLVKGVNTALHLFCAWDGTQIVLIWQIYYDEVLMLWHPHKLSFAAFQL